MLVQFLQSIQMIFWIYIYENDEIKEQLWIAYINRKVSVCLKSHDQSYSFYSVVLKLAVHTHI